MVFRCFSEGIHTKPATKWFVERGLLNMKCPAIFKGSGAHHSSTYCEKLKVAGLDICQIATLLLLSFIQAFGKAKCSHKWSVRVKWYTHVPQPVSTGCAVDCCRCLFESLWSFMQFLNFRFNWPRLTERSQFIRQLWGCSQVQTNVFVTAALYPVYLMKVGFAFRLKWCQHINPFMYN